MSRGPEGSPLRIIIAGPEALVVDLAPGDVGSGEVATGAVDDGLQGSGGAASGAGRAVVVALPASGADRATGTRRFEARVAGWIFEVTVDLAARAVLRERAGQAGAARQHHGPVVVRAPMPGRIIRWWVAVGDTVEAGQRLLAIEAMKMENEVRAPRAGVVAGITLAAGSSVELGDELVTVR